MRIAVAHIHSFGLDWPADRVPDGGIVDLEVVLEQVTRESRAAEDEYFASLGNPDHEAESERHDALEQLAHHVAGVLELAKAIGDRSVGVGPVPRKMIETLGLPCSKRLRESLVDVCDETGNKVGDEVDLVQTMLFVVRNFRYYDRKYDEVMEVTDELIDGREGNQVAIFELAAILAAVCR
jgi:hypothetical protein